MECLPLNSAFLCVPVTNYESADIMFEGRAGGMIVITILVSVGGAVLLIALIVAAVLSNKK